MLYRYSRKWCLALLLVLAIFNSFILMYWTYHFDFKAGILAVENFYICGMLLFKPYVKFGSYGVGICLAFIYLDLLEMRKIANKEQ